MAHDDRGALERTLAHEDAQLLAPVQLALWNEMTTNHRVVVFEGRIFVVWKASADGTPRPVNSLRVTEVQATFARGIELGLVDARGHLIVIGQRPTKLPDDELFLWSPYDNNLQWATHPYDARRKVLRLALAMRMRSHPKYLTHGHTYITDVGAFRDQFPQFAKEKF